MCALRMLKIYSIKFFKKRERVTGAGHFLTGRSEPSGLPRWY